VEVGGESEKRVMVIDLEEKGSPAGTESN